MLISSSRVSISSIGQVRRGDAWKIHGLNGTVSEWWCVIRTQKPLTRSLEDPWCLLEASYALRPCQITCLEYPMPYGFKASQSCFGGQQRQLKSLQQHLRKGPKDATSGQEIPQLQGIPLLRIVSQGDQGERTRQGKEVGRTH